MSDKVINITVADGTQEVVNVSTQEGQFVASVNGQVGDVVLNIPTFSGVVLTYSDQTISGAKTFDIRPLVNGTGVLLSGEAASLPTTLVYTTGDQTFGGIKNFTGTLQYRGNTVLTGIDLSNYYTTNNPSGYITGDLLLYALKSQTGSFVTTAQTGSFVTNSQTGIFYTKNNPSGYITGDLSLYTLKSQTGSFVTNSQTGIFYTKNNPSGYITGVNLSAYTLNANTGSFVTTSQTGNFVTISNPAFSTRPTVNGTGVLLVGEGGGSVSNAVYTNLANQTISGNLNVTGNLSVTGSGKFNAITTITQNFTSGNSNTVSVYQYYNTGTQSLDTIFN
jgi:hypothetical protein